MDCPIVLITFIAVVLSGMKEETKTADLVTAKGSFRVTSDDFSEELSNKESPEYKSMEEKYSKMITATYQKSDLQAWLPDC